MRNLGLVIAVVFLAAVIAGGCNTNTTNSNTSNNAANANKNAASANANANANVNRPAANTNKWANVNANMTREEYEKVKAEYEGNKGSSTIGQGINDSWLWFKTTAMLLVTPDIRQTTINVDVENDVVTLKGTVETPAQKAKAEQVAKDVNGVKRVNNQLTVAPEDSMTNTNRRANRANGQ